MSPFIYHYQPGELRKIFNKITKEASIYKNNNEYVHCVTIDFGKYEGKESFIATYTNGFQQIFTPLN